MAFRFVPDGTYRIYNAEFSNELVGVYDRFLEGPIMGLTDGGRANTIWRIANVGEGGNEITIQSVYSGGFASATQFQDAPLVGSPNQMVWTVVKEDQGFYLQSPNGEYIWELTREGQYAPIVLVEHTGKYNTQWRFERV